MCTKPYAALTYLQRSLTMLYSLGCSDDWIASVSTHEEQSVNSFYAIATNLWHAVGASELRASCKEARFFITLLPWS